MKFKMRITRLVQSNEDMDNLFISESDADRFYIVDSRTNRRKLNNTMALAESMDGAKFDFHYVLKELNHGKFYWEFSKVG